MAWTEKPTERSIVCNAELLRIHRTQRDLTQVELASLAGFTPRLIAKAEAGGTLSPDTVEILAEALSTTEIIVPPEDLVFFPKAIVRKFLESYAQHERQCTVHCQHFLADDVTVVVPGDPSLLPFAGEYQPVDGFDAFWGKFFSFMERHDKNLIVNSMRMFTDGNQIAVLTKGIATIRQFDGIKSVMPIGFIFEFERGKLKRLEDHFDVGVVHSNIMASRNKTNSIHSNTDDESQ